MLMLAVLLLGLLAFVRQRLYHLRAKGFVLVPRLANEYG